MQSNFGDILHVAVNASNVAYAHGCSTLLSRLRCFSRVWVVPYGRLSVVLLYSCLSAFHCFHMVTECVYVQIPPLSQQCIAGRFFPSPRVMQLLSGNPYPFVICSSLGNVLSLAASLFLAGPRKQVKRMFASERVCATIVFLISIFLTLFVALSPVKIRHGKGLLLVVLVTVQFIACLWYCLSYIPFARRFAAGFVAGLRGF